MCGTRSRITKAILWSLVYFSCKVISVLSVGRDPVLREPFFVLSSISCVTQYQNCVWDEIPYYESHSLFSRVFFLCKVISVLSEGRGPVLRESFFVLSSIFLCKVISELCVGRDPAVRELFFWNVTCIMYCSIYQVSW